MEDPFVKEENVENVFDDKPQVKCPTCGAWVDADASYCPICGAKLETVKVEKKEEAEAPKAPKKPRYDENHRLIVEDGEEAPKDFVPSHKYKYGDGKGHSVSMLSLYILAAAFFIPVAPLIFALFGLSSENEKDRKLFKIAIVVNIIVTVIEAVSIWWQITH